MSNYKIRVNGEAKSKEAQELFLSWVMKRECVAQGATQHLLSQHQNHDSRKHLIQAEQQALIMKLTVNTKKSPFQICATWLF